MKQSIAAAGIVLPIIVLTLALRVSAAQQQNPVAEAQVHQRDAGTAYQDGDFAGFTRSLEKALELNPASLATRYNLACGYARTGQPEKALELLADLVAARVDYGMADDPDLASLADLPRFRELVAELASSLEPIVNSTPYYAADELGLVPEGIAHDPATGRLFFGSMRNGNVYVLDRSKRLSKFATVDPQGRRSAIGMTVDADRNLLWVVGTSFEMAENFEPEAPTETGVFGFDLGSGALDREYLLETDGFGLNDVTVGPSGTVYASGGTLRVLDERRGELVPLTTSPALFGSNGIAAHPDGDLLFISSYPVGIGVIELGSGRLRFLGAPANVTLYGIDGLYWHQGDLIGVQNGVAPWRLLRLSLDESMTAVTAARLIEFANGATDPTTGAIVGDSIHYIGQGPNPDPVPEHFPETLAPFSGKTVIRTAPLDP